MLFPGILWNALIIYLWISILGSIIPVHRHFQQPDKGIDIYLSSNGVHTDFVLPIKNELYNWKDFIKDDAFNPIWVYAEYIAFGWGDQGFYLNTPEWKDLTIKTTIKAVLVPTSSAMHVTLWTQPKEGRLTRRVRINQDQYIHLINHISRSFALDENGNPLKISNGYGDYDLFFKGEGTFHLFNACNTWTNDGLKSIGVRSCLWTFYDRAILYQLDRLH